jgi:hypothetical protein
MHHEIHGCDIIIVDDDAVQRLVSRLLLLILAGLDIRICLRFHLSSHLVELLDFVFVQFDICRGIVLSDVFRIK